jgi:hypothetical protein
MVGVDIMSNYYVMAAAKVYVVIGYCNVIGNGGSGIVGIVKLQKSGCTGNDNAATQA